MNKPQTTADIIATLTQEQQAVLRKRFGIDEAMHTNTPPTDDDNNSGGAPAAPAAPATITK